MNAQYIRALSKQDFIERAYPYFEQCGVERFDLGLIADLIQPRLETLNQIPEKLKFLTHMPEFGSELYFNKKMKTDAGEALPMLKEARAVLQHQQDYSLEPLKEVLMKLVERLGIKNGQLFWPLRIAISGTEVTPGGAVEIACLLGKDETLRRLDDSIKKLELKD